MLALEPIEEEGLTFGGKAAFRSNLSSSTNSSSSACGNSPGSVLASNFTASLNLTSPDAESAKFKNWKKKKGLQLNSANFGLNSILDGTPSPVSIMAGAKTKKIKRQSLRAFYGNSVSSPNLMMTAVPSDSITVRRSPRLQGEFVLFCFVSGFDSYLLNEQIHSGLCTQNY